MTGQELFEKLRDSGTGETKLAICQRALAGDPKLTGAQLYNALAAGGAPEGTLQKARDFLGAEAPLPPEAAVQPFPVRAPVGGVTIQGREFAAGERIPASVVLKLTADETRSLHEDGPVPVKLRQVEPETKPATAKAK